MEELTGKFYDIQGFSVHDGPGIRLTLFMKGCPLRCPWCHSPESISFATELNWMEIKCTGMEKCGRCMSACPNGAVLPHKTKKTLADNTEIRVITIDREKCRNCGDCANVCPTKALYMCGTDYTADEIMEIIRRDVPFYRQSGGGVTISGGECLHQPRFVLEILKRCKDECIHTAVDTTGFADFRHIEAILPYTDIFLYDLKCMDSELHHRVIGVPNGLILENARKIASAGGKFQIRIPVIPGFNDSAEAFKAFGQFVRELGETVEVVQLLPYHNLGTVKYDRLHKKSPVLEAAAPPAKLLEARKELLETMGLKVMIH